MYSHDLKLLSIESWIWYGVSMVIVILRYISEYILKKSVKNFMLDDWLMIFCVFAYTIVVVTINKAATAESIFYDPTAQPTDKTYHRLGVILVVSETASLTQLWGVKACMLLLYGRLAIKTRQEYAVKIVAVYCALGYVASMLAFYVEFCHPFSQYFVGYNTPNDQCITWLHYYITQWVFNVTSDLMILAIPISVVWSLDLPLHNKISLCGIFGLGLFIVAAACGNKYYAVTDNIKLLNQWYIREASVVTIVGNLVLCKPVLSKVAAKAMSTGIIPNKMRRKSWGYKTSRPSVTDSSRSRGSVAKSGAATMTEDERSPQYV